MHPCRDLTDDLADLWRSLEGAARLPTQSLAWAAACAESFHADGGLSVVSTEGAVAPLARRGRRLELLGVEQLSEPTDLLARDEAALEALADTLAASGHPLRLERVPADSPTVAAIRKAGRSGVRVRPVGGAPFVRLGDEWSEPLSKISARRRADLARASRRLGARGPIRYEVHAPGPDTAHALLDTAWDVESRSWRAARRGTLKEDSLRGPFFRAWGRRAAADGTLRVALMHVGEDAVAMQLATAFADGYWLLKVGYDEAYADGSPGTLLLAETIRRAAAVEGLATYELLGVVEPWTRTWTEDVHPCVSLRTYPYSAGGAATWLSDAARAARVRLGRSRT